MNDFVNLNEEMQSAVRIAKALAKEVGNGEYSPAHLLKAMLHREVGLIDFVSSIGKDVAYLEEWAEIRIDECKKHRGVGEVEADEAVGHLFEEADNVRLKLGLLEVIPICVLCAMAKPAVAFTTDQLRSFPIREKDVMEFFSQSDKSVAFNAENKVVDSISESDSKNFPSLKKYCVDKIEACRNGRVKSTIGREQELMQIEEILGRFSKSNVIITGDAGVGKTALVDGLVHNIVTQNVPKFLEMVAVWQLDASTLIAGATYKGEIEERLKMVFKELRQFNHVILFIDDIHTLLDAKQGNSGIATVLKSELSNGDLIVIGATTTDEYRKLIEPDATLCRRFEVLNLKEPTEAESVDILNFVMCEYHKFHGLSVDEVAVKDAVRYAKRYVQDRRLPDSAIDLLDRTMAAVKMANESFDAVATKLKTRLAQMEKESTVEVDADTCAELKQLEAETLVALNAIALSCIDYKKQEECGEEQLFAQLKEMQAHLADLSANSIKTISSEYVATVLASKTGIPIGKIQSGEKERLLNMEDILRQRVVGQDGALKVLVDAIQESRSGMNKQGQPIGSFFFLGPTGTGKTELAKALAEALFNDEKSMIRFDMSEFKEEHSAALLYGAPPGYVGYEEGGLLVNKIRQQPYSVVLFDEIEKAHPSVFDIFLQILDEGKMHDRLGKEGDFSNSIIIFTSNVGSEWIAKEMDEGRVPTSVQMMEVMGAYFRPEFLARLSEIVPFSPIKDEMLLKIFEIQFQGFRKLLNGRNMDVEMTPDAMKMLAFKGFTPKYGARQVSGVIRNYLRRPISKMILSGKLKNNEVVKIAKGEDNELSFTISR